MNAQAVVTVDLGFGDAGKGSVVDYLVRSGETVGTVVRYSGGPQAAHRVVDPDGRSHVFSQFGAGTFVPGVRTFLARGTLVNPFNLLRENEHLREVGIRDALSRLAIDSRCVLVTPFHVAANRIRESVRAHSQGGRHGSCGQGIGEARADELDGFYVDAGDIFSAGLAGKLREIQDRKKTEIARFVETAKLAEARTVREERLPLWQHVPADEWRILADEDLPHVVARRYEEILRDHVVLGVSHLRERLAAGDVVFEGAQGVLLDEAYGFHPFTTWTDTTAANAHRLLDEADYRGERETVGIVRAYQTRHGPGPFPTEAPELAELLPDPENGLGEWQGGFRVGWLDVPLLRYALAVQPVDSIAVTCLDRAQDAAARLGGWSVCACYGDVRQPVPALGTCDPVEHGRKLGLLLEDASPVLLPLPPTAAEYAWMIQTMTGTPVSLVSTGPTADDKSPADELARISAS